MSDWHIPLDSKIWTNQIKELIYVHDRSWHLQWDCHINQISAFVQKNMAKYEKRHSIFVHPSRFRCLFAESANVECTYIWLSKYFVNRLQEKLCWLMLKYLTKRKRQRGREISLEQLLDLRNILCIWHNKSHNN